MTIIENQEHIESFLKMKGIEFDGVTVPRGIDEAAVRSALISYLDAMGDHGREQAGYIRDNIDAYQREFCGFVRDGRAFLCCNMYTYDDDDFIAPDSPADRDFTCFMDGGTDVVCFVYDCDEGAMVSLDWNGEA